MTYNNDSWQFLMINYNSWRFMTINDNAWQFSKMYVVSWVSFTIHGFSLRFSLDCYNRMYSKYLEEINLI